MRDGSFLICDSCAQARHGDDDRLLGGVGEAARKAGFAASRPVIEVRGRCGERESQ